MYTYSHLYQIYRLSFQFKANPHSKEYLPKLFESEFSQETFVHGDEQEEKCIGEEDKVTLLFSDSPGQLEIPKSTITLNHRWGWILWISGTQSQ